MLEATTRPAMVPGWWRRWPAWSPSAVMAWSVLYGALALSWAAGEGRHLRRLCAATAVRHHQAGLGPRPHPPLGGDLARWVPFLAGRRVPVALPTILGGVAALAIMVGGLASSGSRSSAPWGWRPSRPSHRPGRPGPQAGGGRSGESPSPSRPSSTTTVGTTRAELLPDLLSGGERHAEVRQGRAGGRAQVPAGFAVDHGRRLRRPAVRPAVGAMAAVGAGGRPAPRMPTGHAGMGALPRHRALGRLLWRGPADDRARAPLGRGPPSLDPPGGRPDGPGPSSRHSGQSGHHLHLRRLCLCVVATVAYYRRRTHTTAPS
jgi:hypothetical protein